MMIKDHIKQLFNNKQLYFDNASQFKMPVIKRC